MTMLIDRPATVSPNGSAPATTLRACIYCRVSSAKQEERGYSLDGQRHECRTLAEELGAAVVLERWEVGSGADWDLPVLLELLEAAKRGEYDLLIVYDTSRLARDIGKLKVVERTLNKAGVQVRYVRQEFDDSPAGQLQKDVMAAVDSFERGNLAVRFKLGKRAKVARGLVMGQGRVPYGFRRVVDPRTAKTAALEIDPAQAAIVRRIVAELHRYSVARLAERLTAEGVPTPTGVPAWSGASIYAIVNRNPAIYGEYVHGKRAETRKHGRRTVTPRPAEDWTPVPVPPIVSRAEVEAARAAMAHRKAAHGPRRQHADDDAFSLRGLLRCGRCGGQLSTAAQRVHKRLGDGSLKHYGTTRYYECIRSKKAIAARANLPPCDIAWLPAEAGPRLRSSDPDAEGIEEYAWSALAATVLDPEQLGDAFNRICEGTAEDRQHEERIGILGDEIAKRRRRLDRITVERLDAEPGSEAERSLATVAAETSREIGLLQRELEALKEARPLGVKGNRAEALMTLARDVVAGLKHASPVERRHIYEMLKLRAVVTPDPNGDRLGRHCYRIDWEGLLGEQLARAYSQSMRRNQTASAAPISTMEPTAYQKPYSQSLDGVNWKFMP